MHKRRSVAPVIATLLMVAIAVVGGMLVFVFAQDFFTQTDSMTGPTIEILQVYGYDARDFATATPTIRNHQGSVCSSPVGVATGTLADADVFAVYVRNLGSNDVIVQNISVYNIKATASAVTSIVAGVEAGKWTVMTSGNSATTCTTASVTSAASLIKPGQDATIFIGMAVGTDSTDFTETAVKSGRPVFVKVETSSGSIFPKQLVNGRAVG